MKKIFVWVLAMILCLAGTAIAQTPDFDVGGLQITSFIYSMNSIATTVATKAPTPGLAATIAMTAPISGLTATRATSPAPTTQIDLTTPLFAASNTSIYPNHYTAFARTTTRTSTTENEAWMRSATAMPSYSCTNFALAINSLNFGTSASAHRPARNGELKVS